VATNISSVNSFSEVYRIDSSAPTTSLDIGDLYFDTTSDTLKVYGSGGWQAAGSSVNGTSQRYHYDISGTPTSVTGADANGNTLTYDAGYVDVYVNGVRMSTADVTVTSGDTVTFAEALADGDEVDIVGYGTFSVASLNADNLDSGTVPDARITGAYTGITNLTMSGNLTVDTNTLYVDSTNNRVGIGTTGPATPLDVRTTSPIIRSTYDSTGTYVQMFHNGSNSYFDFSSGSQIWRGAGQAERMRIDSSGNLLVGKTAINSASSGVQIEASGTGVFGRSGSLALIANRNTNNGDIVSLRKDGATIGVLGVEGNNSLYIGTGDTGFHFSPGDVIRPWNPNTNASRDAAIDLGLAAGRYKDLYLSGGVYLGGTGGANYLDDYEQASFTAYLRDAPSGGNSVALDSARYVKIGKMVNVWIKATNIDTTGLTGGNTFFVTGLPFVSTNDGTEAVGSIWWQNLDIAATGVVVPRIVGSVNYIRFDELVDATTDSGKVIGALTDDQADLRVTISYTIT
jgi:predicted RecA/RadA family phage recombinase